MSQTTLPPLRAAGVPQTTPDRATFIATAEYEALLALLHTLSEDDWLRSTDCTGWTVRDVVAHLVGALDEGAHRTVFARHALTAWRRYRHMPMLDGINEAQIDDRRGWSSPQLVTDLARLVAGGVRGRRRVPGFARHISLPAGGPLPAGAQLSYLFDVIYTRDTWMHRVDITRAVGRSFECSAGGGEVVEQVLRDVARQWQGPPVVLELRGPEGGRWALANLWQRSLPTPSSTAACCPAGWAIPATWCEVIRRPWRRCTRRASCSERKDPDISHELNYVITTWSAGRSWQDRWERSCRSRRAPLI